MPTPNSLNDSTFIVQTSHYGAQLAGAGMVIPRPAASHVQLTHMNFELVADANAGNRLVTVSLELAAHSIILGSSATNHTAGLTFVYIGTQVPLLNMGPPPYYLHIPLPPIRSIQSADTYAINITNVQAGDQLDHIHCRWRVWRGLS